MDTASNSSVDNIMLRASLAGAEFTQFTQEQTDAIVRAVAEAGFAHRVSLANSRMKRPVLESGKIKL